MTTEQTWLLPTALVALLVLAFAQAGSFGLAGSVVALLIVTAGCLLRFAYRAERERSASRHFKVRAFAILVVTSAAVAAAYALVLTVLAPRPSPLNLLWVFGIPLLVGLILRPRLSGLALGLPLAVGGLLCLMATAITFRLPILSM